ncbi:ATP-binding protein [Streptomyces sp. NPDC046215]|uniref:Histidine kinase/HSP90-like ATPase domain-containing protein n=1 Tax=Streptomyces stramineus TaxID=173861 RepID=A0ABN1A4P8_9ACTN
MSTNQESPVHPWQSGGSLPDPTAPAYPVHPSIPVHQQFTTTVLPHPYAIPRARHAAISTLSQWAGGHVDQVFRAELVIGELLANSIRHALPQEIRLTLTEGDGALVIEVEDGGGPTCPSTPVRVPEDCESGRGLGIVSALAHSWSWHPAANGRRVTWVYVPPTPC